MPNIIQTKHGVYDVDTIFGCYSYLIRECGLSSDRCAMVNKLYVMANIAELGAEQKRPRRHKPCFDALPFDEIINDTVWGECIESDHYSGSELCCGFINGGGSWQTCRQGMLHKNYLEWKRCFEDNAPRKKYYEPYDDLEIQAINALDSIKLVCKDQHNLDNAIAVLRHFIHQAGQDMEKEREHSEFMERLFASLWGDGWEKATINDAKTRHDRTITRPNTLDVKTAIDELISDIIWTYEYKMRGEDDLSEMHLEKWTPDRDKILKLMGVK